MRYWFKLIVQQLAAIVLISASLSASDISNATLSDAMPPAGGGSSLEKYLAPDAAYQFRLLPAGSALWQGLSTVAVKGDYAFCSMVHGLEVVDISNPASPVRVARKVLPGNVTAYESLIYGDLLAIAAGTDGLRFIDISNPLASEAVTTYPLAGVVYALALKDNLLLAADAKALHVFDLSNAAQPVKIASLSAPGSPYDIAVVGNYAYVSAMSQLWTVSLANPTQLQLVTNTPATVGSQFQKCTATAGYLFTLLSSDSIHVYDLANPVQPALANAFAVDASAFDISVIETSLVVVHLDGIDVYDLADPQVPTEIGTLTSIFSGRMAKLDDTHAILSEWYEGFSIVDLTVPSLPVVEGDYVIPGFGQQMELVGDYVFEANGIRDLQVLDVSDPLNPLEVAHLETAGTVQDIVVVGNLAYLSDFGSGLRVVDISDPLNPTELGFLPMTGYGPVEAAIVGDLAYVTGRIGFGLHVVDISNPTAPALISSSAVPAEYGFESLAYSNGVLAACGYAAGRSQGWLFMFDVSEPTVPVMAGSVDIGAIGQGVEIQGNYAYAMDWYYGMSVVDITDPYLPTIVGSLDLPDVSRDLHIEGNYAYIANYTVGVGIADISNPLQPELVAFYNTQPVWIFDVRVEGNFLYACGDNAFLTFYLDGCGGPDGTGVNNISDVVFLINYIFAGGPAPFPERSGDLNCDEIISISDAVHLISYIFSSGPAPCGGC